MKQPSFLKHITYLFLLFVLIDGILIYWQTSFTQFKADPLVIFTTNCILFILSATSVSMHANALKQKNPSAALRTVMTSMLIKLFVLGIAALLYIVLSGAKKSDYAIFIGMLLYIIYTAIEVSISTRMNQKDDA